MEPRVWINLPIEGYAVNAAWTDDRSETPDATWTQDRYDYVAGLFAGE